MGTDQHHRRLAQILDTSRSLFFSQGYDKTSISQIVRAVGIAKGTFYHYFRSKDDLLKALVEEISQQMIDSIGNIAEYQELSATQRLTAYFRQISILKADNRELIMPMLHVMYRPENLQLRIQLRERSLEKLAPIISSIISEGVSIGEFSVEYPNLCGEYIIGSFSYLSEQFSRMILSSDCPSDLMPDLLKLINFMEWTLERLLGAREGSIILANRASLSRLLSADEETAR